VYSELFKLCGFEPEEIERERPRIDRAFQKLEIGPKDIARGEERLRKYFDVELLGVRKLMGIWLKILIDLVLAREEGKKLIYPSFPPLLFNPKDHIISEAQNAFSSPFIP